MDKNIQKLEAFVAAVEAGSFTQAAGRLHYSQSGISRMIADLEKEWQVVLLERGKTGVSLTPSDSRLLPYARRICRDYQKLQMEVDDLNGLQSGLIRIGTFSSVATHYLPAILRRFRSQYPGIEYELLLGDYSEIEDWIDSGRVDLGFLRLPAHKDFETIPLMQDQLMAVIPPQHPLADLDAFPMEALCQDPFMLLEKGSREEISAIFEKHHLTPQVVFTTWDDYAIMSMVENGLGISILPSLILQRVNYHILAKPLEDPAFRSIGAALRDRKSASPAVHRFLDFLKPQTDQGAETPSL